MSYTDPFKNDNPYKQEPGYPTTRNASRQDWRRLRKAIRPSAVQDLAADIVAYMRADGITLPGYAARSIRDALVSYPWDLKDQQ